MLKTKNNNHIILSNSQNLSGKTEAQLKLSNFGEEKIKKLTMVDEK